MGGGLLCWGRGGWERGQTSANMTSFSRSSLTKKINAIRSQLAAQVRQSAEPWASAGTKATFPLHTPPHGDGGVLCPSFKNPNSLPSQPSCRRSHASCSALRVCQAAEHTASGHHQGHRRQEGVLTLLAGVQRDADGDQRPSAYASHSLFVEHLLCAGSVMSTLPLPA